MTASIVLNSKLKPASRDEAYKLVLMWARGEQLSPDAVQRVVLYFAPPRPKTAKDAWTWLKLYTCANLKDTKARAWLQFIHCNGTHAFASDGYTMAWIECDKPPGAYDVRTDLLTDCPKWSGFDHVLELNAAHFDEVPERIDLAALTCHITELNHRYYQLQDLFFNADYCERAFLRGTAFVYTFGSLPKGAPLTPLVGSNDYGRFVIAPMEGVS